MLNLARRAFKIRLITKASSSMMLSKLISTHCCPKNSQDHSPLRINCMVQRARKVELPRWYICHPAMAIQQYRNVHTIGKAIFGGLQGALLSAKYQSPGLNRPPNTNTAKQINKKATKLGHFSRSLSDVT